MKQIYLIAGVPGSGKSTVCNEVTHKFNYYPHDSYKVKGTYVSAILEQSNTLDDKPILMETPFSVSELQEPLERAGYSIKLVYIIEAPEVLIERYERREGKPYPKGNLTRNETYRQRSSTAEFSGTSIEVLNYLKSIK